MAKVKAMTSRTIDTELFLAFRNYVRYHQQREVADPLDFTDGTPEAKAMWTEVQRRLTEIRAAIGAYKAAHDIVERSDVRVEGFICPGMKVQALSPELIPEHGWAMHNLQEFFAVWDYKENAWAVWLIADPKAATIYDFLVGSYGWLQGAGMKEAFDTFERVPLPKREKTRGRLPQYLDGPLPPECWEECKGFVSWEPSETAEACGADTDAAASAEGDSSDGDTDAERRERQDAFQRRAEADIRSFGRTVMPVLFMGETGVGKGYWARKLHEAHCDYRKMDVDDVPFLSVNCPGITLSIFESEMFGSVKTAFTGAADRPGKVGVAEGGILFLDEIGDLPIEAQVKLLGLIDNGEYFRVGEDEPRPANARFVAATNTNLPEAVKEGKFRDDLYWRLVRGHTMRIPPLRERRSEIPEVARSVFGLVVAELGKEDTRGQAKRFTQQESAKLADMDYDWPGNVRELEGAIRRAIRECRAIRSPLTAEEIMEAAATP